MSVKMLAHQVLKISAQSLILLRFNVDAISIGSSSNDDCRIM